MSDLMVDGLNLALYGMGFVFVFLILLVGLTAAMSAIVGRYFPAPAASVPSRNRGRKPARARNSSTPAAAEEQQRVVAAISAAIRQHQNTRRS